MLMAVSSSGAVTITGEISGSDAANALLLSGTGSVGFTTTSSFLAVSSSQQQVSASYIALSASYNTFSGSASTRITVDSASLLQVSSSQQQISSSLLQVSASYISLSGSYNTYSSSVSTRITVDSASLLQVSSSQQQISSSLLNVISVFATTGSNSFRADQSITGSLVVSSTITAQTLVVQTVTSSIVYSSGSNIFGSALTDRQTFTGSMNVTGSGTFAGSLTACGRVHGTTTGLSSDFSSGGLIAYSCGTTLKYTQVGFDCIGNYGWIQPLHQGTSYSNLAINPVGGCVGIGITSPAELLEVSGSLKIGNLKIQNSDGGRIGFNRNTSTGAIYNSCYSAFQINGAFSGTNYLDFQNYNSSGSYIGGFVLNNGNIGICTSSPATLLANTSVRPTNADGLSLNLYGLDWAVNGQGYAGTIWNTSATANNYNAGLLVRICSTDVTDKILDLESGGVNRFRMLGTGVTTFACQVCAPSFVGGTLSGTSATITTAGTACTVTDVLTLANSQSGGGSVCAGAGLLFTGNNGATVARIYSRGNMNFNNGSDLVFQTQASAGGTPQCTMVINGGSQNVGIGTFNPGYKLDVYRGSSGVVLNLQGVDAYDAETGILMTSGRAKISGFLNPSGGTPGSNLRFYTMPDGGSVTERLRINSDGIASFASTICAANAQIGCINSYNGVITSNGVITKSIGGTMAGNTATYFDFPTWDDAGQGQMFEVKAFFDHYFNFEYGTHLYRFITSRDTSQCNLTMFNCTSANGGSWLAYKTSSTNLRVCKIAGTYAGGGAYWIQVTGKQP